MKIANARRHLLCFQRPLLPENSCCFLFSSEGVTTPARSPWGPKQFGTRERYNIGCLFVCLGGTGWAFSSLPSVGTISPPLHLLTAPRAILPFVSTTCVAELFPAVFYTYKGCISGLMGPHDSCLPWRAAVCQVPVLTGGERCRGAPRMA
jgi:hypothetical protein